MSATQTLPAVLPDASATGPVPVCEWCTQPAYTRVIVRPCSHAALLCSGHYLRLLLDEPSTILPPNRWCWCCLERAHSFDRRLL